MQDKLGKGIPMSLWEFRLQVFLFSPLSNCYLSTEIVFLRTTVPAYGSYHLGSYDVKFDILEGNVDNAFDIIKRVENGMYVGEYCMNAVLLRNYHIRHEQKLKRCFSFPVHKMFSFQSADNASYWGVFITSQARQGRFICIALFQQRGNSECFIS